MELDKQEIRRIISRGRVLFPDDPSVSQAEYSSLATDRTKLASGTPAAVVFVSTIEELTGLIRYAGKTGIALVPSGGRTGYAGGAASSGGDIIVSLISMNRVLDFDPIAGSLRVEGGMIVDHAKAEAEKHGFYFPIDFAASGSATVGGAVATNAGGMRVIRYGVMRNQIMGMTFVDGNGEIHRWNGKILKNNTGLDLMQLAIGSEGILGFIVDVTLKLTSPPGPTDLYLFSVPGSTGAMRLLEATRKFGAPVFAFEYFNGPALKSVQKAMGLRPPFSHNSTSHILMELEQGEKASEFIEAVIMSDIILDAVQAESQEHRRTMWNYREGISESISHIPLYKNDVSIPSSAMESFFEGLPRILSGELSRLEPVLFGHLGDGNLHLNFLKPEDMSKETFGLYIKDLENELYPFLASLGGSVSAEHGIGLIKKHLLPYTRSKSEIQMMRKIKNIFDPQGILNPGKIFDLHPPA